MIPLTAWLTRVFGMRRLLLACAVLFTVFSMLCGLSHDLVSLVIGRVGQGFFGGALIPTAQTITRTRLPARQVPLGLGLFGVIMLLGPLIGPVLGGCLTENASWRWCFFMNLPVAAALVALLMIGLPKEGARLDRLIQADWLGIGGMTIALSALTIVLEEGQRQRWFESREIVALSLASSLGFAALLVSQVTAQNPVLKLRLLLNRSYASVIAIVLVVGVVLFGILYVLPQFLALVSGYDAEQSGQVLFLSGIPSFVALPLLPLLLRANPRVQVFAGLSFLAMSCFLDTHLSPGSSGKDFIWSQLLRGAGQMLAFLPLNQASVGCVAAEDAADAAGLFNMARNLGGSIGLALLGTFIDRQVTTHVQAISASITANSLLARDRLAVLAASMSDRTSDAGTAHTMALSMLSGAVERQALVITFSQAFWVLGSLMLCMLPLVLLLRMPRAEGSPLLAGH